MTVNLDREEFRAWLRAFGDDEPVGVARNSSCCPLASYLWSLGAESVVVDAFEVEYRLDGEQTEGEAPGWIYEFIAGVDGAFGLTVPAWAAKDILEAIQ